MVLRVLAWEFQRKPFFFMKLLHVSPELKTSLGSIVNQSIVECVSGELLNS